MAERTQVVIVGGGPVGMALAIELGRRGVACVLVESRTEPHRIPKGQNLTQRTLEHFHFWGIEAELRAARVMPPSHPIGEITAYGDLMSEYWQAPAGREVVRPYYFRDNERLPQYRMEAVLRAKLAVLDAVECRFGSTAREVAQDADRAVEQFLPRLGQFDTAVGAGEQRNVEFVFEPLHMPCQRRLCNMQVRGGAGNATEFGDTDKIVQAAQFHRQQRSERSGEPAYMIAACHARSLWGGSKNGIC